MLISRRDIFLVLCRSPFPSHILDLGALVISLINFVNILADVCNENVQHLPSYWYASSKESLNLVETM